MKAQPPMVADGLAEAATGGDTGGATQIEELRFLVTSGRLRHWQRGVSETLVRAGFGAGLTVEAWAATPWYGPLEEWLTGGSTISDILINGPGCDIGIVDAGQRMASGVTLHPEWLAWVQRQLLLRSQLVRPEQVADLYAME